MRTNHPIAFMLLVLAAATQPLRAGGRDDGGVAPHQESLPAGVGADWWNDVQQDIARSEYRITRHDAPADVEPADRAALSGAGFQAPNRAQNFRIRFMDDGVTVFPQTQKHVAPPWEWGLSMRAIGRAGAMSLVEPIEVCVQGNRAEYDRGEFVEWYINDERGLEQGFTIRTLPGGATSTSDRSHVRIELAVTGNVTASLADGGAAVDFLAPDGALAIHFASLHVIDVAGRVLQAWFEVDANVLSIVVDDHDAVYPVTIDPLATSPSWTASGNQTNASLGSSVAPAGDVNGDGHNDVIVGVGGYNGSTGRAIVYHGTLNGLSSGSSWTADGEAAVDQFGSCVATAGDVNGDGYSDVIVGALGVGAFEGRAYVFHGSASGLSPTANWIAVGNQPFAIFGHSVSTAGDVNGDGFSDVIVGAYGDGPFFQGKAFVYHGSASGLSTAANWTVQGDQEEAWLGWTVATAGDVNGDGYSDVVVGSPYYGNGQSQEGRAFVYHGSPAGLNATSSWMAEGDQDSAYFGIAVATAGDVNGDGYSDVIVGAPDDNFFGVVERAIVYHGSASGLSPVANWTAQSDQQDSDFGTSVATAGDVNGDGYSDVIVGAYLYDNVQTERGRAFVYHGSSSGLGAMAAWTADGAEAGAWFGYVVATAGDITGDGQSEVLVGAPKDNNGSFTDAGHASLYSSATQPDTQPGWVELSPQDGSNFGFYVASAGDVNGDGFSDVIIGAPQYDNGETNEGAAFVYHGSATGLSMTPDWSAESNQASANFGAPVSGAGDVNGDGYDDVIIACDSYDNGQTDEGRAFVYYGSSSGLSATPNWFAEGNQDSGYFGWWVANAGDVNGDGFGDVIISSPLWNDPDAGAAWIFHGSSSGLSATADWMVLGQVNSRFGENSATARDVNGDGYGDVIISSPSFDNPSNNGRVWAYYGSSNGVSTVANWMVQGQAGWLLGWSISTAGDVNGDGYSDVIVGAPLAFPNGYAFVYHGSLNGLNATPNSTLDSPGPQGFGGLISTAGDVNGDGYADVIVSHQNAGRLLVYRGAANGVQTFIWEAAMGSTSLAMAGDVNGDGYSDVISGNGVAAFVFQGIAATGLSVRPQQRRADDSAPIAALGASNSGNGFRLAQIGRSPLGRGKVQLQWEIKPLGTPFNGSGLQQSTSFVDSGIAGANLNELASGLAPDTPYHWRMRTIYAAATSPFQRYGRWITNANNGWNEADLRTAGAVQPADINGDGVVNITDLLAVISFWGICPPGPCPADVNGDGVVNIIDLLAVIAAWG